MYRCRECERVFDEPDYIERCAEDYYGVGSMFPDRHYEVFVECPYCGAPIYLEEDEIDEEDLYDE